MPILRPFLLSNEGQPVEADARRGMNDPEFYTRDWRKRREQRKTRPALRTTDSKIASEAPSFIQEPVTQDYLANTLARMGSRTPPPSLEPAARVKSVQGPAPDSFKSYYEQLATIGKIGQAQVASAQAVAEHKKAAALAAIGNTPAPQPGGGGGNAGQGQYTGGGAIGQWISQAAGILAQHGINLSNEDMGYIQTIIQRESGGNPNAINNWDSNAAAGIPSKGLMQTIDPTFNSNKIPGYNDIYNPVHNIIAGVRYAIRRYGSLANVPGIRGLRNGTGYVGY